MERRYITYGVIIALVMSALLCINHSRDENVTHPPFPKEGNYCQCSENERLTPHPGSRVNSGISEEMITISAGDSLETVFWITAAWEAGTAHLEFIGWSNEPYPFKKDVKPLSHEIEIEPNPVVVVVKKGESKKVTLRIKTSPELEPGIYWIHGCTVLQNVDAQFFCIKLIVTE